jgi:hypothetical protein
MNREQLASRRNAFLSSSSHQTHPRVDSEHEGQRIGHLNAAPVPTRMRLRFGGELIGQEPRRRSWCPPGPRQGHVRARQPLGEG